MIKIIILVLLVFCKPADPNYRLKPLLNTEYTGFISRSFFQVIVEVPVTREEVSILEEREICKKDSFARRDKMIIPILKSIAMESKFNEKLRLREKYFEAKDQNQDTDIDSFKIIRPELSSKKKILQKVSDPKKSYLNKGEFAWFLDTMFLYSEDYKSKDKCIFIFRKIEADLFAKVSETKLGNIGEDNVLDTSFGNSSTTLPNSQSIPGFTNQPSSSSPTNPLGTGVPIIGR